MESMIPEFLKGQFLISMPSLSDPNFQKTVTLICEHSADGAFGIIINRAFEALTGKHLFQELSIDHVPKSEGIPVYGGGPVRSDEIFIIHGAPFEWEGIMMINSEYALSNTIDILKEIALGKGPESFIIVLGCAGWGPGQLEFEMKENTWLTGDFSKEIIFDLPIEKRWDASMRMAGVDPVLLSERAGHA